MNSDPFAHLEQRSSSEQRARRGSITVSQDQTKKAGGTNVFAAVKAANNLKSKLRNKKKSSIHNSSDEDCH